MIRKSFLLNLLGKLSSLRGFFLFSEFHFPFTTSGRVFLMKNIVPHNISSLMDSADKAKAGLVKYKAALGLHYSDPDQLQAKFDAFNRACGDFEQGKLLHAAHRKLIAQLTTEGRSLAMIIREMLKPILGPRFSRLWEGPGFKNYSLETPRSFVELRNLIFSMGMHLEQYTEANNPPLAYMGAKARALATQMKNAFTHQAKLDADFIGLLRTRTTAQKELRCYLRRVIDELHLVLPPMDQRWREFGLNQPGRKESPDTPENVTVNVIDNKQAEVKWPAPARAEYFKVWMRVVGVDEEPKWMGSPTDSDFMFEELPPQSTLEISVSAVNRGGESSRSAVVTITTV